MKMEPNDEVVERQKLVDVETEEDVTNSAPKSAPTPASPMAVPKINVSFSLLVLIAIVNGNHLISYFFFFGLFSLFVSFSFRLKVFLVAKLLVAVILHHAL